MKAKRAAGDPGKVIGYIRRSTDQQRNGPEAQRAALAAWCEAQGRELVAVYQESVSGGAPIDERAELMAALAALPMHGAGVLLVATRDRLARDTLAAAMIERLAEGNGARVLSADGVGLDDTPEGALARGIADLFAQYERAQIRARIVAALAVKAAKGEPVSRAPRGLRIIRAGVSEHSRGVAVGLEADPDAREGLRIAARCRELRARGKSLRAIAAQLHAEGYRPERGRRFYASSVRYILRNGRLADAIA